MRLSAQLYMRLLTRYLRPQMGQVLLRSSSAPISSSS